MIKKLLLLGLISGWCAIAATAQPATAPARHVVVVPPGFQTVTVGGYTALAEPADETWVRQTLGTIKPTTQPTTMPADLLAHLDADRATLAKQMADDLALADAKAADEFFDQKLQPMLKRFAQLHLPLFYLVTTEPRLKELINGGWSDPRVYYNRAADNIEISGVLNLTIEGETDDILLPALYAADDSQDKKQQEFAEVVQTSQSSLSKSVAERAMALSQVGFLNFIAERAIEPLKLKPDQEWLGVGLMGVLSAKYSSSLIGLDTALQLQNMTSDDPRNPIRPEAIDLLHPLPRDQMRPAAVFAYDDAFRRKSARAVKNWLKSAGDAAVPKLLSAMRQNPPADGAALLKQIQQISGVDLSADVATGS